MKVSPGHGVLLWSRRWWWTPPGSWWGWWSRGRADGPAADPQAVASWGWEQQCRVQAEGQSSLGPERAEEERARCVCLGVLIASSAVHCFLSCVCDEDVLVSELWRALKASAERRGPGRCCRCQVWDFPPLWVKENTAGPDDIVFT